MKLSYGHVARKSAYLRQRNKDWLIDSKHKIEPGKAGLQGKVICEKINLGSSLLRLSRKSL